MMQIPATVIVLWTLLAFASLLAVGLGLRAEGRWFAERGKARSWRTLRICTLPIAISSAGLVIIVTRSIRGPEALAVFFVALLVLAPIAYFGLHWVAARWIEPRLSGGEIAWIGFTGLLALCAPPAVLATTNPWVHAAARLLDALF